MDWDFAIERQREALKRVLAALVAMAGLAGSGLSFSPCGRRCRGEAETDEGYFRPTLPRHLHRAVLRLLRPAESAARRLVIVAARGLVVTLPPLRPRKPKPRQTVLRHGVGTGIWMPPHLRPQADRPPPAARSLPLFDLLRPQGRRVRKPASGGVPRLCTPGLSERFPVAARPPLSPGDRLDAARLALRLQALASALDDLPREARRFARWRMRRAEAAGKEETRAARRFRRLSPLRPGRPPGSARRSKHEVHDILKDAHSLACLALESPDTS